VSFGGWAGRGEAHQCGSSQSEDQAMGQWLRLLGLLISATAVVSCIAEVYMIKTIRDAVKPHGRASDWAEQQQATAVLNDAEMNAVIPLACCVAGFLVGLAVFACGTYRKSQQVNKGRRTNPPEAV